MNRELKQSQILLSLAFWTLLLSACTLTGDQDAPSGKSSKTSASDSFSAEIRLESAEPSEPVAGSRPL